MNQPIIQIKDLCKSYPSKKGAAVALEHINLDIYPSEIFGIIGMSGAGKSTLVRCINFLEKPTSGTVIFDGQDLSKLSGKELCKARQSMGMIFQQFNLLMQRTALQNICFPMEIARHQKRGGAKACPRTAKTGRHGKQGGLLSFPVIRRSKTACCHCPRFGHQSQSAAVR